MIMCFKESRSANKRLYLKVESLTYPHVIPNPFDICFVTKGDYEEKLANII